MTATFSPGGLTDEQVAARRLGLGASDIPAICGLSSNSGPLTIYRSKVDGWQQPSTEQMEFGHRWEKLANEWFADRTGFEVIGTQSAVIHPSKPWAMATLDGYVASQYGDPCDPEIVEVAIIEGVVEHKSFNVVEDGDVKADVLAQALWQLYVTGLPTAWITGLVGHAFIIRQVHAADHADNIAWLVEQAERFWFDHVVAGVPPAPTRADLPMLEGITATPAKAVEVTTDIADAWAERQALKATVKALADRIDGLDAQIRAAVGDAEVATVAGFPILTCKAFTTRRLDTEAVRATFPEIAACRALHTTTVTRTLRTPPKNRKSNRRD